MLHRTCTLSLALFLLIWPRLAEASEFIIRYHQWEQSELSDIPNDENNELTRNEWYLAARWGEPEMRSTLSYAHQPLRIRSGEPAHNGYFHQFDFAQKLRFANTLLDAKAGVHGSSNMFKHGDLDQEAVVLTFSALQKLPKLGIDGLGINGDYRFGTFLLYPRLTVTFPILLQTELLLDLPVALLLRDTKGRWQFGLERYGEKWATLDADREVNSKFYLNEWRVAAYWRFVGLLQFATPEIGAGISFDTEVRYLDLAEGTRTESLDPSFFVSVGAKF